MILFKTIKPGINSLLIVSLLMLTLRAAAQDKIKWPTHKKAAIVLTYDDALASHLNIAIPQLNKYKLAGTFFLDGRLSTADMRQWRTAAKQKHELANHSLYHPCSEKSLKAAPRFTTESYDVPAMLKEIGMMNKILFGIDGQETRTYAYPCTQSVVGGVDYTEALQQSKLIKYARGGGDKNAVVTNFSSLQPLQVPAWGVADNTGAADLLEFVKNVQQQGGLGVIMFHGVGGDYLKVSAEAHEQLLLYLAKNQKEIWVGTFQEVMDFITATPEK
jgi:peptidoglycan/xylan/chitin deacetylase (PgdA/CDA1 family)